jgi:tetratricopeptide (TPR) repeat protein
MATPSANAIDSLLKEGHQARSDHRSADAKHAYAQAVEEARALGDQLRLAQSLTRLGGIERDLTNTAAALALYEQAVEIYCTLDVPLNLAHTVRHVGDIALELNELTRAQNCYEDALAIYALHPEAKTLDLANAFRGYALLKSTQDKTEEALELWRKTMALYNIAGIGAGIAECKQRIAALTTN